MFSKREKYIIISHRNFKKEKFSKKLKDEISKRENEINYSRHKFSDRGRNWRRTELTLTEGVLMNEN